MEVPVLVSGFTCAPGVRNSPERDRATTVSAGPCDMPRPSGLPSHPQSSWRGCRAGPPQALLPVLQLWGHSSTAGACPCTFRGCHRMPGTWRTGGPRHSPLPGQGPADCCPRWDRPPWQEAGLGGTEESQGRHWPVCGVSTRGHRVWPALPHTSDTLMVFPRGSVPPS